MPRPLLITALQIEHNALRRVARDRAIDLRCLGPGPMIAQRLDLTDRPRFVLLAGVAGGLVDDPPARTSRVIDGTTGEVFTPGIDHDPAGAVIVSVAAPADTPDAKRTLAATHGAHLADCEAASVARVCEHASVPWGVLRTVSDGPEESLPPQAMHWVNDRGGTRIGRVLLDTLKQPTLALELKRLAANTSSALRTLAPRVEQCLDDLA